jgi:hypothetical protein
MRSHCALNHCHIKGKKKQVDIAQMRESGKAIMTILANIDIREDDTPSGLIH